MTLVGAVRLQINGEANGTLGFLVDFALKNKKVHFCATMTGVQLIIFSSTAGPTENRPLGGL